MMSMRNPVGAGTYCKDWNDPSFVYILKVKNLFGCLKKGKVPVWRDVTTGEMVEIIDEKYSRYIWLEELQEYEKWYDLEYDVESIIGYKAMRPIGMKKFIDKFYTMKFNNKGAVKNGAKLFLNSSYGKLSQRLERVECHYQLDHFGIVHLVRSEVKQDTSSMMSIIVGSRVTSQARITLLKYIDVICK